MKLCGNISCNLCLRESLSLLLVDPQMRGFSGINAETQYALSSVLDVANFHAGKPLDFSSLH